MKTIKRVQIEAIDGGVTGIVNLISSRVDTLGTRNNFRPSDACKLVR